MGMYRSRPPLTSSTTSTLEQGDILASVYQPLPPVGKNLTRLDGNKIAFPSKREHLVDLTKCRAMCAVEKVDFAIVLSNSCDNERGGHPLILAPIKAFTVVGDTA